MQRATVMLARVEAYASEDLLTVLGSASLSKCTQTATGQVA